MRSKQVIWLAAGGLIILLALFEVSFDVRFSLPQETTAADDEQEARYLACYEERDREIHRVAFGTIDNPDVQKLYISNNRALAADECRQQFPEQLVTVEQPFSFNLVDLRFRYGDGK